MIGTCDLERVRDLLDVRRAGLLGDDPVRLVRRQQVDPPLRAPVVVPAADQVGGPVVADQPGDEVEQPAHRVDRRAVGRLDLRHAEERPEVHRGGVEEHQASGLLGHEPHPATHRLISQRDSVRTRRHRPEDPRAARRRRPDVLHRPRQGDRAVDVGGAPAGQAAGVARPDPGVRRDGRPRAARPAAHRVHLDPPDRPVAARRLARAGPRDPRDRVLLVGRRRRVLHPQGPGRLADRARGPAGPDPRRRERLHPHHDRAVHAVREPPGHLTCPAPAGCGRDAVWSPTATRRPGSLRLVTKPRQVTRPGAPPYGATPRPPRRP